MKQAIDGQTEIQQQIDLTKSNVYSKYGWIECLIGSFLHLGYCQIYHTFVNDVPVYHIIMDDVPIFHTIVDDVLINMHFCPFTSFYFLSKNIYFHIFKPSIT
jgi:hypothetical protein